MNPIDAANPTDAVNPTDASRLERRLERERAARAQAEVIAERALRDLYVANQELDRRVMERTAELEVARREAADSDSARSEFLRVLSREMRTPLNGVLGMIELLGAQVATEQMRLWTASASASAGALNELVTRLLLYVDLDRPTPGPPEELHVGEIIRDSAQSWERRALQAGQLIVVEDRADSPTPSFGYRLLVRALVDEVVGNAVQHADPGPLRISVNSEEGRNSITVSDSGPGFDGADRLLAVDRLASPSDSLRGIGYSLVTKLAARTRADVSITAAAGSATVVEIRLAQTAAEFDSDAGLMR